MTWHDDAACKGLPTEWWFPDRIGTGEGRMTQVHKAKQICSTCPVQTECLNEGLYEPYGIWGGLGVRARWEISKGTAV